MARSVLTSIHWKLLEVYFFHLCNFAVIYLKLIYNEIWKEKRKDWSLDKKAFTNYRKNHGPNTDNLGVSHTNGSHNNHDREYGYISPFNDFRNFKLEKEFLFILFSSSNFLHSGSFLSHLKSNDFIDYSSPICSLNYSIYNV